MARYSNLKSGLNSHDFIFKDAWQDTLIKQPGSMKGQQFQMMDCQDSELYIFDTSACVYIDQCRRCYIFVAPCQGSIFIRNCTQCIVIGFTRQFRVRDCTQCVISLWCQSQPVIESSSSLIFDCFPNWGYSELKVQIESMGSSVWNNNWWDIYDFTKLSEGQNYRIKKLTENDLRKKKFLQNLRKANLDFVSDVVPRTEGVNQQQSIKCSVLVYESKVPVEFIWDKLNILQAKLCVPPEQLKKYIQLPKSQQYLFIKIASKDIQSFQNRAIKLNLKFFEIRQQMLEEMHDLIFVPFKEEH